VPDEFAWSSNIHDRMTVIVLVRTGMNGFHPGNWQPRVFAQHAPYRAEEMSALAVSPLLNSARPVPSQRGHISFAGRHLHKRYPNSHR